MEKPILPRRAMPWRRGLFALALSGSAVFGAGETINLANGHADAEASLLPAALQEPASNLETNDIYTTKHAETEARKAAQIQALAAMAAAEATSTASTTIVKPAPAAPLSAVNYSGGSDATNPFTPDWYRCVIDPESSNRPYITSGLFGILVDTWQNFLHMSGVPGNYSSAVQGQEALIIFHDNGGFGPPAWNNSAGCHKNG